MERSQLENSINGTVGSRLRDERRKIGASQRDFSRLGGVGLGSQNRYEADEGLPPIDYLLRIGEAGADWYWIVTGERIAGESLSEPEARAVDALRRVAEPMRTIAVEQLELLADRLGREAERALGVYSPHVHEPKTDFLSESDE